MSLVNRYDYFEEAVNQSPRYCLKLYVIGREREADRARINLKEICEEYLPDNYDLEVIDILEHPQLATDEQIIAVPTLIKKLPEPLRRVVGDFSDREKVLLGLDLVER